MREFYVYGFKSREEYTGKSARSYDDERRRVESWLGDYMMFRQKADGKNVFLSIDSRVTRRNPLYRAWKTKSFTDGDITLHFILFDILDTPERSMTLSEIMDGIYSYLGEFPDSRGFDESTVRKKLKEYITEGIIKAEKRGRQMYYSRADAEAAFCADAVDFFAETAPCGVVGSFLLDKTGSGESCFAFKHHYMTGTLDSEIICTLFEAMRLKRYVTLASSGRNVWRTTERNVVPLRIFQSVQNGRQYLMAFVPATGRIRSFRTDSMISVAITEECPDFDRLREKLGGMTGHIWGVSTEGHSGQRMEHVDFTVCYAPYESHIYRRMEREKRCGSIEQPSEGTVRFTADVYDCSEPLPWIRTFIGRITELSLSDEKYDRRFRDDLDKMYEMYGIEDTDECTEGGDTA